MLHPRSPQKMKVEKKNIYVSNPFSPMEANLTHSKCHGLENVMFYYEPLNNMIKEKSMFEEVMKINLFELY